MMIDICTRAFSVEKSGDSEVYDYRTQKDVYYKSVDCCLKKKGLNLCAIHCKQYQVFS